MKSVLPSRWQRASLACCPGRGREVPVVAFMVVLIGVMLLRSTGMDTATAVGWIILAGWLTGNPLQRCSPRPVPGLAPVLR
jgi:hypothetical protein